MPVLTFDTIVAALGALALRADGGAFRAAGRPEDELAKDHVLLGGR